MLGPLAAVVMLKVLAGLAAREEVTADRSYRQPRQIAHAVAANIPITVTPASQYMSSTAILPASCAVAQNHVEHMCEKQWLEVDTFHTKPYFYCTWSSDLPLCTCSGVSGQCAPSGAGLSDISIASAKKDSTSTAQPRFASNGRVTVRSSPKDGWAWPRPGPGSHDAQNHR